MKPSTILPHAAPLLANSLSRLMLGNKTTERNAQKTWWMGDRLLSTDKKQPVPVSSLQAKRLMDML